jgi:hypothetical protein
MSKAFLVPLLGLACIGLPSCALEGNGAPKAGADASTANVPEKIRQAASRDIGAICTLESINGKRPRVGTSFPPKVTAIFQGWARIADRDQPAPPIVYLILRPEGGGADQDVYLEMGRMPRPDQSGSDSASEMIGFEGQSKLPGEGAYEARVWQGTSEWGSLCTVSQPILVEKPTEPAQMLVPVMEDDQAADAQE